LGLGFSFGAVQVGSSAEVHLHPAGSEAIGARPDPWLAQGLTRGWESLGATKKRTAQTRRNVMSFKGYDKQTFIVDSAKAFGQRRISKREFLKRMGVAGIGFSGFAAGLLGNSRMRGRGLVGSPAMAELPDDQTKFL